MRVAVGMVFGRLTVKRLVSKRSLWECLCECGAVTTLRGNLLTSGRVRSCGCYRREVLSRSNLQHGATGTREFSIWRGILKRCNNPACAAYPQYGGRGIRVCERWATFPAFIADMGPCPDGHSIDRIDNDGNYESGNCRWADRRTQNNNSRRNVFVTVHGERMTLKQATDRLGIPYHRARDRIKLLGWSTDRALEIRS